MVTFKEILKELREGAWDYWGMKVLAEETVSAKALGQKQPGGGCGWME